MRTSGRVGRGMVIQVLAGSRLDHQDNQVERCRPREGKAAAEWAARQLADILLAEGRAERSLQSLEDHHRADRPTTDHLGTFLVGLRLLCAVRHLPSFAVSTLFGFP